MPEGAGGDTEKAIYGGIRRISVDKSPRGGYNSPDKLIRCLRFDLQWVDEMEWGEMPREPVTVMPLRG